jgi:hypothetical protein
VFVALGIHHAMRVRSIMSSSVTCPAVQCFSVLSRKRSDFFAVVKRVIERKARPRTQHDYHHDTKVKKPEAATAVIEHLMMRGKTPETC